ncbi:MAG TPA: threonine/serine exporter family protein [Planctomycetota bacterium]|nr:threonine/serine exporter family protein [Planctomycetota bacterium]
MQSTRPAPARAEADQSAEALLLALGRALHTCGAASYRVEEVLGRVAGALGVRADFFAAPTELMYAITVGGVERTSMQRIEAAGLDLGRQAALEALAQGVVAGTWTPDAARAEVARIAESAPDSGPALMLLAAGTASAGAACFFGGGVAEIAFALLAGLAVGLVGRLTAQRPTAGRLTELLGALLVSLLATLAARIVAPLSLTVVTLAGVIGMVPGLTLTVGIGELAVRHLASGTARLAGALVVFLMLGFGAALGSRAGTGLAELLAAHLPPGSALAAGPLQLALPAMPPGSVLLAVVVAGLSFSVLFAAPRRDWLWVVVTCALAYAGDVAGAHLFGARLGGFLGALVAGLASSVYARVFDRPSVVTRVPAMTMLVPGSLGFLSISALLVHDAASGIQTAFDVGLVAVALSAGLLAANLLLPPRRMR